MRHALVLLLGVSLLAPTASGCGDDDDVPESIFDGGTDLDVDTDSDSDTDADTDTGTCEDLIWEGDYSIDAGADIEPLVSYAEVTGDLIITADGISNISALQCLRDVGGDLLVLEASNLVDLGGLQALDAVGGNLAVTDVPDAGTGDMSNVTLPSLSDVGGDLVVTDHPILSNLSVSNLTAIGGDFVVARNPSMATLTALDLIAINGSFVFTDNDNCEDFDGMYPLSTINGDLTVVANESLPYCQVCDLLDQLSGFDGDVTCHDNVSDTCWADAGLDCP